MPVSVDLSREPVDARTHPRPATPGDERRDAIRRPGPPAVGNAGLARRIGSAGPVGPLPLQAGNAAVARHVDAARIDRRGPDPARVVAAEDPDFAELEGKTLAELHSHAVRQVDWHRQPKVAADPARADRLRQLLAVAEKGGRSAPFLAACGDMKVADLLGTGLTAVVLDELTAYADGHAGIRNVTVEHTDDLAKAREWGRALIKLATHPGEGVARMTIKQGPEGHHLQDLISAGAVDDFVKYCQTVQPLLTAENGAEIDSYLMMRTAVDPITYHGKVPHVRNYHHFTKAGLDALIGAWGDTTKSKPLTLVVHTPLDHNGAFHRDAHLESVLTFDKSRRLTLLMEGAASLGEITGLIGPVAKAHGQGGKISQVMLAGHGEWNVLDLAGTQDPDGTVHEADARVQPGKDARQKKEAADTTALFNALLDNLERSPNSRILLNGCLTNTHDAPGELSKDPAKAKRQLRDAAANTNLMETLQTMATAKGLSADTVMGANASFTSAATLMDPATGQLKLADPTDPALVSKDKFEYIRIGVEPEGVMRAVLEKWPLDQAATETAMRAHLPPAVGYSGVFKERVAQALLEVSLAKKDLALMNQLSHAGRAMGDLWSPENWSVGSVLGVPRGGRDTVLNAVATTGEWGSNPMMRLIVLHGWVLTNPAKDGAFLDELGAMTCSVASDRVDTWTLKLILSRLIAQDGAHHEGVLRLALIAANHDSTGAPAPVKSYLRTIRGPSPTFADPKPISAALGGLGTVDDIEFAIDEAGGKPVASGGRSAPKYNVDLDGDGKNDFYLEEMTRMGAVAATLLNVRERPGMGARIVERVPTGEVVTIIGSSGDWYAIERGGTTRFVFKHWVTLTP